MIAIYRNKEIDHFLIKYESRRTFMAEEIERSVLQIIKDVRDKGDEALISYTTLFDKAELSTDEIEVSAEEMAQAHKKLHKDLLKTIQGSIKNIEDFHRNSLPKSWFNWQEDGVVLGQRVIPMQRVGIYVPGGRAAYPSSLIMGVVPARVAGVSEVYVVTPCNAQGEVNPVILAIAHELKVTKVFRVGGSQAIAALAYGTASIPRVDKIVGPGNIYVATAKKLVFGQCGMDMIAGPSEVVIIADDTADAEFAAADLLAQAEHDPLASSLLLTSSEKTALAVQKAVSEQMKNLKRTEILSQSLQNYGAVLLTQTMQQAIDLANRLAPEHLGLHVQDAWHLLGRIQNAGAIFLGSYSPETVGDYWAGPNHILPTNGSARFFSPLRAEDFVKFSSVISYTLEALNRHSEQIVHFAQAEGLDAHAQAVIKRVSKNGKLF
ncbi:MAG TPA: histidinol dehydrogenase [bacterium]|nr:histidinol dehydrogenase [bacterium]HPN33203.1 histidinol dehydrogenase [bacterium]